MRKLFSGNCLLKSQYSNLHIVKAASLEMKGLINLIDGPGRVVGVGDKEVLGDRSVRGHRSRRWPSFSVLSIDSR